MSSTEKRSNASPKKITRNDEGTEIFTETPNIMIPVKDISVLQKKKLKNSYSNKIPAKFPNEEEVSEGFQFYRK